LPHSARAERVLALNPEWAAVVLADRSGVLSVDTRVVPGSPLPTVAEKESFVRVLLTERPAVGSLTRHSGKDWLFAVRAPVLRDGSVRYVLTALVKPDAIRDVLTRQQVPGDWVISIMDASGARVARSRAHEENLGGRLSDTVERVVDGGGAEGFGLAYTLEGERIFTPYSRSRRAAERESLLSKERQAREAAETADRAKEQFMAVLSHELRTPLNAVYGWARMLQGGQLRDEALVARAKDAIVRNADVQVQLIDDLLDLSRITSGKMRLEVGTVDMPRMLTGALDAVRPAADAKMIRIHTALDPDGYSLIRKLRALAADEGGETPAVALTAYGRPQDRLRSLAGGFNMHVPKPVDPGELTAIIAGVASQPERPRFTTHSKGEQV
jgi:signal transduction histidine kinase